MTPGTNLMTPEMAMKELGIAKTQYHARLTKLGIKARRIHGKAYLDEEQMEKLRDYSKPENAIATLDNEAEISLDNVATTETEISEPENAITTIDNEAEISLDNVAITDKEISEDEGRDIYREAAELKAQQLITPDLIKLYIAAGISEKDLPPDLLEKVQSTRESANPKKLQSLAGSIADKILAQHQSQPQT